MKIEFERTAPANDEVAAILAVLNAAQPPPEPAAPVSAWKLAALAPDLSFDELRAAALGGMHVR